jgi:hypothetical protein
MDSAGAEFSYSLWWSGKWRVIFGAENNFVAFTLPCRVKHGR